MKFNATTDLRKFLLNMAVGETGEVPHKYYRESSVRSMCNKLKGSGMLYSVTVKNRTSEALVTRLR